MLETIGARLKKARADRRLTTEQAAAATRIKVKYLEALENDQRQLLPSDVQGRGFLRLYAAYLGLEPQPLLDAWANDGFILETLVPPVNPPEDTSPVPQPPSESETTLPETLTAETPDFQAAQQNPEPPPPPTADQIFGEIGVALKQRREKLGLKLADVERYILVRQYYLEALEKGKMEELPSLVQARGMLNNYARFLELDVDGILLKFASALQTRRLETQAEVAVSKNILTRKRPAQAGSWRMLITPDLIIGGAVVISLLFFALWSVSQITAAGTQQSEPNDLIALPQSLLSTPELLLTATLPEIEATRNPEDDRQETGTNLASEAEPTQFTSLAPLQLNIIANQRAYLRIVADGKIVFNDRVSPGNAYTFSAENQIELLTGNAGALQVYFNQNDLGVLGVVGQVASQIFTIGGIVTPTAQFSPTPTETLQPTVTPLPSPTVLTPTVTPFIP
ncbi:MAG: DUF4115 domain-containing protein [Anaerolineae bacterium]|nr:DUF4115 domain-containing protein [Anaerolineae bacterium]